MSAVHFHLIINHFPVISLLLGCMVLFSGLVVRSESVKRVGLAIFVLAAVCSVLTVLTGNESAEVFGHSDQILNATIHQHRQAADTFAVLSYMLGIAALLGLWTSFHRHAVASFIVIFCLLFCIMVLRYGIPAATTGTSIRHTEIKSTQVPNSEPEPMRKDNDD